jgi:tetratricopeptide (TPR) repeat protein
MLRSARAGRASACFLLVSSLASPVSGQGPAVAPPPAQVDRTEEAKALFAAGRSAFEAGRYQDALGHFERCYEISQRAALLYNIGITHDRLRDDERALHFYDSYLAAVPTADNRVEVETRSAAIRSALERRKSASPATAAAPAPSEAAATVATPSESYSPATDEPADRDEGGLLSKWWFWTAVGVVAVGAISAGAIVVAKPQPRSTTLPDGDFR